LGRSPYYRWVLNPITESELGQPYLANAIFDALTMTRSSATGFSSTRSPQHVTRSARERCGGSARTTSGGACSGRRGAARRPRSVRRHTTIWFAGTYLSGAGPVVAHRFHGASDRGRNDLPTFARSRMGGPTGSWAARSPTGWSPRSPSPDAPWRGSASLDAGFTRTEDRNFEQGNSSSNYGVTGCPGRWARSAQPATTRPWRCSYQCQAVIGAASRSRKRWRA
jgi:hypothetical protein